jgi:hypothetical protein
MGRFRTRIKTFLSNLLLAIISVLTTIVVAELGFRAALFSDIAFMKRYRVPERYAYGESDDYWKLDFLFGSSGYKPPKTPHPLLGWVGWFDRETYRHDEYARIRNKRPVLLYGDSFASCSVSPKECFHGILNSDPGFSKNHFLLNYGVGGYGVSQIFLLYQKSIGQYKNPFVIVSMLTEDLDRSVLSVRVGQTPFFRIVDNSLALSGIPIGPSAESFYSKNPPEITSYLFRMFVHSDLFQKFIQSEGPPWRIKNYFRTKPLQMREQIEQINRHIILEIIRDLRERNLQFLFLIFHPQWALRHDDWRDEFLIRLLDSNNVPYLSSKLMLKQHASQLHTRYEDYYLAGGHPNGYQNRIIANELKSYLLAASSDTHGEVNSSFGSKAAITVASPTNQ